MVMYHAVGRSDRSWSWDELNCPYDLFARQLSHLSLGGYRTGTLADVHEAQRSNRLPVPRTAVLTFDDGYLDNWVFAFPLLRRAGWRGLIYVNPEFVEPGEETRPNLEDTWAGRCSIDDLPARGFVNWGELTAMVRSGVMEIGSHSMTHTWYPTGPEIEDFHRPGNTVPWLAWNARPDRKPFYRSEDQRGFVPWGTPIHRNGRSLGIRRFFPDPDIAAATVEHVTTHGGTAFFERDGWREVLLMVAEEADRGRGRHETDQEMIDRFRFEIEEARRVLVDRLGRGIDHHCWPGGAYRDESWQIAEEAGFQTITIKKTDRRRWLDAEPRHVRRIGSLHRYSLRGRSYPARDAGLLISSCDVEWGRRGSRTALRLRKLLDRVRLLGGRS